MAANKRLSATITIGGALAGSFKSAMRSTQSQLGDVGRAIKELTARQKRLAGASDHWKKMGRDASRFTAELGRVNRELQRQSKLQKIIRAQSSNVTRRGELRGQMMDAVALGAAVVAPVTAAVNFEFNLREFGNIADLSDKQLASVKNQIESVSDTAVQSRDAVLSSLQTLVGGGLDIGRSLEALPAIGRTATATGAAIEDLSKTAFVLIDTMGVSPKELPRAMDMLAKAGKEGNFELRDMAQFMPMLAAQAQSLGMKGGEGVATLAASLQIARKGAGDASTAANNLANFMGKLTSPETVRKFAKMGVNIEQEFKAAMAAGKDPVIEMIMLIEQLTGGDKFRMGELFGDKQVLDFLNPMLQNLDEFNRIRSSVISAQGVVEKDFQNMAKTSKKQLEDFTNGLVRLGTAFAVVLLPPLNAILKPLGWLANRIAVLSQEFPLLTKVIVGVAASLAVLKIGAIAGGYAMTFLKGGLLLALNIGTRLIPLFPMIAAGIKAVGVAMAANPVGLIIAAIGLAAALVWKYWEPISGFFSGIWDSITSGLKTAWEFIKKVFSWSPLGLMLKGWGIAFDWLTSKFQWLGDAWAAVKGFFGFGDDTAPAGGASGTAAATGAAPADKFSDIVPDVQPAHAAATKQAGGTQIGSIPITVNAQPGQDPRAIAEETYKVWEEKMAQQKRGALFDDAAPAMG